MNGDIADRSRACENFTLPIGRDAVSTKLSKFPDLQLWSD
jgi:hypothetical protein